MSTCPHCNGHGETRGFINARPRHYFGAIKCRTCDGVGEVGDEVIIRINLAKKLRQDRWNREVTIRVEAKRLGCDFGEWSRIEAGREPETDAGRAAYERRLQEIGELF